MPVHPRPLVFLVACACALIAAAPAAAGSLVEVEGAVLRYVGDDVEPGNVTIAHLIDDGLLRLDENASRMTTGAGCTASADRYRVDCADAGVERIEVRLGMLGSDVRIRADLPADVHGGPGDDLIVGGPADDALDGGAGQDILGGGPGADLLIGGPGEDLVTYSDRIAADGTLLGRREGVTVAVGPPDASGAPNERDTIERDVEQLEGGAGADRFLLRDGFRSAVACADDRDTVIADPRDTVDLDCEGTRVAPPSGGTRPTTPTLPFPFASVNDRSRSTIAVEPLLPLQGGAIVLRVTCPAGLGLLELVRAPACRGRIRFTRTGGAAMGVQRITVPRGRAITVRLPLSSSRAIARTPAGLAVTATALPDRGDVERRLSFTVRG